MDSRYCLYLFIYFSCSFQEQITVWKKHYKTFAAIFLQDNCESPGRRRSSWSVSSLGSLVSSLSPFNVCQPVANIWSHVLQNTDRGVVPARNSGPHSSEELTCRQVRLPAWLVRHLHEGPVPCVRPFLLAFFGSCKRMWLACTHI